MEGIEGIEKKKILVCGWWVEEIEGEILVCVGGWRELRKEKLGLWLAGGGDRGRKSWSVLGGWRGLRENTLGWVEGMEKKLGIWRVGGRE